MTSNRKQSGPILEVKIGKEVNKIFKKKKEKSNNNKNINDHFMAICPEIPRWASNIY